MRRNLRNIFHRLSLSEQDISTLRGMFVRLVEGQRGEGKALSVVEDQSAADDKG